MVLLTANLLPQERFDLQDINLIMSSSQLDFQFLLNGLVANSALIANGFKVASTIGNTSSVSIAAANSTVLKANNLGTDAFSFLSLPSTAPNLTANLIASSRNYVEMTLTTVPGTPLTRNFWDPTANNGLGGEFLQEVNTVVNLEAVLDVTTSGFTNDALHIPLAIIDTNGSNAITAIFDARNLMFRLGRFSNEGNQYTWSSQTEPVITMVLSGVTGTFVANETVTFTLSLTTEATATVTSWTPGTLTLQVNEFSLTAPSSPIVGDTVTGNTSGATGTVVSALDSFSGADKDIANFGQVISALQTQVKAIQGTPQWFNQAPASLTSLYDQVSALENFFDAIIVANPADTFTPGPEFAWDGSNLSITDGNPSPSSSDIIALLRVFGVTETLSLARQDGQASTSKLAIGADQVLFVELPSPPANTIYSGQGALATNYQVANRTSFVANNQNIWLAYSNGSSLYVRGFGPIKANTSIFLAQGASGSGTGLKAVAYDPAATTLPTGSSYTVDGYTVVNGDTVLFSNLSSGNNEVYEVSGVGSSLIWTAQPVFTNGSITPSLSDEVTFERGTEFTQQTAIFNGTTFLINFTVRYFNGLDFWEQTALITSTLANNTTNGTVFSMNATGNENIIVDFSISRNSLKETGTIWITSDGTNVDLALGNAYTGITNVSFSVVLSSGNIILQYTTDNSSAGTMKYSIKHWSDGAGGPTGVPVYSPYLQNVSNSAFAMSDASGVPINCTNPTVVGGDTQLVLGFTYVTGMNAGTTVGNLDVYVNGQRYPRFVSGSTLDGYYVETNNTTITFNTNISTSPLSIEVIKRF